MSSNLWHRCLRHRHGSSIRFPDRRSRAGVWCLWASSIFSDKPISEEGLDGMWEAYRGRDSRSHIPKKQR